jgi:hypothetical protein
MTDRHREGDNQTMPDHDAIRALVARDDATIDGLPARIYGSRLRWALVASLDGTRQATFAWPTVARVMASTGNFRT